MVSQPLPHCIQPPQLVHRHTHQTATPRAQTGRSSRLWPSRPPAASPLVDTARHTRASDAGGGGGAGGGCSRRSVGRDRWLLLLLLLALLDDFVSDCIKHCIDVHCIRISTSSSSSGGGGGRGGSSTV
jgi:hypothetical protein